MKPTQQSASLTLTLAGQVAVVTGAASGIGQATVLRLTRAGVAVGALDTSYERLGELCALITREGGKVHPYAISVTDCAALEAMANDLQARFGPCCLLVNNAGVLLRSTFSTDLADPLWSKTLDVNLSGPYRVTQALCTQLETTQGCIVNVASIHAYVAVKNSIAYTASKGGVKQMTQALALELGPRGIRVNAVAPGLIDTAMTKGTMGNPESLERFLERVPLLRAGTPDDVTSAICFLASDYASYITGVTLPVDGGYLAQ